MSEIELKLDQVYSFQPKTADKSQLYVISNPPMMTLGRVAMQRGKTSFVYVKIINGSIIARTGQLVLESVFKHKFKFVANSKEELYNAGVSNV